VAILAAIRAHLADGGDLADFTLPDEPDDRGGVLFAPGAWDGIATHHIGPADEAEAVAALYDALVAAMAGDDGPLAEAAREPGLVGRLDPLLARVKESDVAPSDIYRLADRLATTADERGLVKLGIALLGLFRVDRHRDVLLTLGRHDEFTLYAAVALARGQADAIDDLWRMARSVRGWGRVHLVERLAGTSRADVLDWILREGFRNEVMDEYLALVAATRGDLAGRLAGEVDDELLHAAGDLLVALVSDGPAGDMYDYPDGATAARRYLDLMRARAADLRHLLAVTTLRDFAAQPEPGRGWPDGWTPEVRAELVDSAAAVLARPEWPMLAQADLWSDDRATYWRAGRACARLGVATLPVVLARLPGDPYETAWWDSAVGELHDDTVDAVVAAAERLLPLAEIAAGPGEEFGLGPAYQPHRALDIVLPELAAWPGRGWALVAAGLASPVVRNRNNAVRTLAAWPRTAWPDDAEPALRAAVAAEPRDDVRARLAAALAGEPLP
jgi:hypothetical protein